MRHSYSTKAFSTEDAKRTQYAVLYATPTGQQHAFFPTRRAAYNAIHYIKMRKRYGKTLWRPVAMLRVNPAY